MANAVKANKKIRTKIMNGVVFNMNGQIYAII